MIKRFKDFFSKKYTQEELDDRLDMAIRSNEYEIFVDCIEDGANINKHEIDPYYDTFRKLKFGTVLMSCIFNKTDKKFIKHLINCGVDLYDQPINVIDIITRVYDPLIVEEIKDCITDKCPEYVEQWKLEKDSEKYNM